MLFMNSSIKEKAKFNLYNLNPEKTVGKCFVPALFVHGKNDNFVLPHHSVTLTKKYAGAC